MTKYRWVQRNVVLAIHEIQLVEHGGEDGIIDQGLLESALDRPKNLSVYENANTYELAASYVCGILQNHPFVDGNKRTAFVVGALFLELNGLRIMATEAEAAAIIEYVVLGQVSEEQLSDWFLDNTEKQ